MMALVALTNHKSSGEHKNQKASLDLLFGYKGFVMGG